jgi:hypothetical protein
MQPTFVAIPSILQSFNLQLFNLHSVHRGRAVLKHGNAGPHLSYDTEFMIVAVHNVQKTKAGHPNTEWLYQAPFVNSAADYSNCWYCPPMMGSSFVRTTVDGKEIFNPFQKPQLLIGGLVRRLSPPGSVIAELTAGALWNRPCACVCAVVW